MSTDVISIKDLSVSSLGIEGNGGSFQSVLSADGSIVAYWSDASNFVPGDTNSQGVFYYNQNTNQVEDISLNIPNALDYFNPSISSDGRYVAFSDHFLGSDGFNKSNLYVFDQNTKTLTEINGGVGEISADGQTVVFESDGIEMGQIGIGITSNTGQTLGTIVGNTNVWNPAVSGDGNYVAFYGADTQLTTSSGASLQLDASQPRDAFVFDRATNTLTLISKGLNGADANGDSGSAPASGDSPTNGPMSISANGQYIAFESSASNLVSNDHDTNGRVDIFVYNTTTQSIERVSVAANGGDPDGSSTDPSISANGQYVTFASTADNLVAGVTNGFSNIYVYDLLTNTTTLVSVASDGEQANGNSLVPQISADGTQVTFTTAATNLFPGDTNGSVDVVLATLSHTLTVSSITAVTNNQTAYASTGHPITITMTTSEAVTVTGIPTLQLNDNEVAAYTSGSGTNTLTFTYTVQSNDIAGDLQVTGLNLPSGATITGQSGALSGSMAGNLGITVNNAINDSITELYVGYYNRAPDTAGETYWVGQLQGGMSLSAIAQSYSVQTESTNLYPFLASPNTASTTAVQAFVTSVYENLFNRAPDTAGENYWVTQLQTGASTVGGAIINIISGAQLNDLVTINNKVAVGDYFDAQLVSHNVQFSDSVALSALGAVTSSASSVTTAEALVNAYIATAPPAAQAATASQAEVNLVGVSPNHDLAVSA